VPQPDPVVARPARFEPGGYALPADVAARVLTPALVVYLDRVRANLRRVIELVGDPERWRPHVKTAKIPEVLAELAHAGVRHFKCATTRELEVLLEALAGAGLHDPDVLVAYAHVGPALARSTALARAHPRARVSILCEDPDEVARIPARLSIFVDVNPGMDRCGIPLERHGLIAAVARAAGARFRGIHAYEGHLHEADLVRRERRAFACYARLLELVAALGRDGLRVDEVVTSGTPSFLHALRFPRWGELGGGVQCVSPGTVVYHDLRSEEQNPGLGLVPAALVLSRVVSHPCPGRVTLDAGSKALAAEAGDPCAQVLGRPELAARTPSEEHLPVDVLDGSVPRRGEALLLVPRHVCPTVNLAEQALLVEGGAVRAVVSVAARAHDVLTL